MKEGQKVVGTLSDDLFCVRGVGILLVVFIHVLGLDPAHGVRKLFPEDRPELRAVVGFIHSFNMAVMIIGSGVAVSAFGKAGSSLAEFACKKLNKLIVPMLLWAPVLLVTQELSRGTPRKLEGWLTLLGHMPGAWFPPYSIFWFVHVLVWCTLSAWLFQRFAAPALGRWAGLVLLGLAVLLHLAVKTWRARVGAEQGDYVELILYWNRFFSLGMFLQPWLAPVRAFLARLSAWRLVLLSADCLSLLLLVYTAVPDALYEEESAINGPIGLCLLLTLTVLLRTRLLSWDRYWLRAWSRLVFIG
ncbi:MAG: acyltransferase family protein, partial [Archangium sp.]